MARLWSSGFELNTTSANVEWTSFTNNSGLLSINTGTVRSGTYALKNAAGNGNDDLNYQFASANSNGPYYARVYYQFSATPGAATTVLGFTNATSVLRCYIKLNTDGSLGLYTFNGTTETQVGSNSSVLSTNTWYLIEIYVKNNTVSGKLEVTGAFAADDGSASSSFASTTTSTDTGGVRNIFLGRGNSSSTFYWDDVAINDTTGSNQTTYPGPGKILHLRPNAVGDNNAWTRAGTNSGANWSQVNEVTPNDATNIVTAVDSTTLTDDYNINDTPAAIGSSDTINVVQVGVRGKGSATADSDDTTWVARFKKAASGTVSESANVATATNTYFTNQKAVPHNYALTLYANPDASTITKATLDTSQIGLRANHNGGFNQSCSVSTEWLLVDWTPATNTFTWQQLTQPEEPYPERYEVVGY